MVGTLAAITAGRWSDRLVTVIALVGISMPIPALGLVARYFLAESPKNPLFPDTGYVPLTQNPWEWLHHLILPWFVLSVIFIGFYGRVLRSNILDAINEDYVRTAKAKGLAPRRVLFKHVLRNSLLPTIAVIATQMGYLIGGLVVIEKLFNYNGIGQRIYTAAVNKDFTMLQSGVLVIGLVYLSATLIADILYSLLNPRIRYAAAE